MKKFYMTLVAMLCGATAMAQENALYVEDVTIEQGATVDLPICLKNDIQIVSLAYTFDDSSFPAGVSVATKAKELSWNEERLDLEAARLVAEDDELDYEDLFEFSVKKGNVVFQASIPGMTIDGEWVPVPFKGNDGAVVYHPFTVAEDCELTGEGEPYTIVIKNIGLGDASKECQDPTTNPDRKLSFKVTVTPATGIIKVNADDPNAPVYNVAGQRVSKAQKGIFIQNGKKVAVK